MAKDSENAVEIIVLVPPEIVSVTTCVVSARTVVLVAAAWVEVTCGRQISRIESQVITIATYGIRSRCEGPGNCLSGLKDSRRRYGDNVSQWSKGRRHYELLEVFSLT